MNPDHTTVTIEPRPCGTPRFLAHNSPTGNLNLELHQALIKPLPTNILQLHNFTQAHRSSSSAT